MNSEKVKSATMTILQTYRDEIQGNDLMYKSVREDLLAHINKTISAYEKGLITSAEALKVVTEGR